MSDELRLPDDLAACEARLAAHPLEAPRLSRDELLYRTGWAAAEAERLRKTPGALIHVPAGRRIASWSLASAALAASLAVVVTLNAVQPSVAPQTAEKRASPEGTRPDASSEPRQAATPSQRDAMDALLARIEAMVSGNSAAGRQAPASTLFALSGPQRRGRWDEPILISMEQKSPTRSRVEFATARQLLDEYLPQRAEAESSVGGGSSSGFLKLLRPLTWSEDTI